MSSVTLRYDLLNWSDFQIRILLTPTSHEYSAQVRLIASIQFNRFNRFNQVNQFNQFNRQPFKLHHHDRDYFSLSYNSIPSLFWKYDMGWDLVRK
jgi:hypothetical protein